ncbi:MAG: DUF1127 domain-containing protein [Bosea sp.]|uniref:DUF1127 domain-containing protein n=1 Tax=Bosea sp. (in: a-proteobacteria) TaxID=1871050 RepID=UPI001AD455D6|nr:DUF1127 domain-containing protein [Bosea sp. (in: a-proteobacteria)]MBN9450881.1 DUF1127 domain-containing protein [Bosea sp. (in: a-proteobacteria)]
MLLMTIAAKSLSSVSAGVARAAAIGFSGTIQLVRALAHRREVMRLSTELDERALKDIGLVRSDIDGALATSWLDDPSAVLAERSRSASSLAAARREHALRHAGSKPMLAAKADIAVARCA